MQTPSPDLTPDPVFEESPVSPMVTSPELSAEPSREIRPTTGQPSIYTLLFILILLIAAFLRFRGIDWDEYQYVHPDERFLGFVENDIQPVKSLGEYFDTANSTLNPMNRGHGFFVYGTLPIFLLRYTIDGATGFLKWVAESFPNLLSERLIEWSNNGVFANYASIGRPLSGLFDLATIVVLYVIASKLFNQRVGLLAAAFSALAVLQIQLSHFFTVDIYATFFIWLALYFAVQIASIQSAIQQASNHPITNPRSPLSTLLTLPRHPAFVPSLLFGIFSGMALASKISAYPIVLMLPLAAGIYLFRQPAQERTQRAIEMVFLMAFAGLLFALAFRIFQPYAFTGPGFFGVTPNPEWVEALTSLQNLLQPSIGYPPAVQWINRPVWFSGYNITAWGLGWPLGLAAWVGMLWMGWRIFRKREFQPYLVVWAWTTGHFIWQSLAFNPTMRYQLPIYPGLALLAAWGISELWSLSSKRLAIDGERTSSPKFLQLTAYGALIIVLVPTFLYALAFSGIYTGGVTRLTASRWMFDTLPGPINLQIESDGEKHQQVISFPAGYIIRPNEPYYAPFVARNTGVLNEITLGEVVQERTNVEIGELFLQVLASPEDLIPLATSSISADFSPSSNGGNGFTFALNQAVALEQREYTLKFELRQGTQVDVCGSISLLIQSSGGQVSQPIPPAASCTITPETALLISFVPATEGILTGLDAAQIVSPQLAPQPVTVRLQVSALSDFTQPLATATRVITPKSDLFTPIQNSTEAFPLDAPVNLVEGETYYLQVAVDSGGGQIWLGGTAIAVESSWDDSLPYRVDNYDPYGGIYQSGLNFEMYWFDDEAKRQRFYDTLDGADVVTMSSNRQWGSVGRLDQVYPISSAYYRYLLGCPEDRDLQWCYIVAEPGMFQGQLGFELIQTFDANPRLGPLEINDQFAEEAFTVYDHPKVFIFAKTAEYDPARVEALLDPLPLGRQLEEVGAGVQSEQPQEVKSLLLTPEQLSDQQNGGTWSELFNADGLLNTNQFLAIFVWYGAVTLLGIIAYPLVRLALPGLNDRGYPLARTAGVLILSYMVWLAGSLGIPVLRVTITMGVLLLAIVGLLLGFAQWKAIQRELKEKWRYFLTVEGLTLAFFLFLLLVRLSNPDLWHPWKGGEKPMDFAYLNAVIRSTTYPPYDPWFANGYINYYYYGFVFVGVLVKWLGIMPAIAYNLILPTLFSMLAMGAFSVGWNLVSKQQYSVDSGQFSEDKSLTSNIQYPIPNTPRYLPLLIGLIAAIGITILGNLGTPKLILRGYERLGAPPEVVFDEVTLRDTFFLTKWGWAVRGLGKVLDGESLPIPTDHWYWNPSRAIPAPNDTEPITEFPFFTFLYADLHAHMMALPITLLALSWVVSVVLSRGRWENWLAGGLGFLLAGITIGALRPTNTWDFPTYLALGSVALVYGFWQGHKPEGIWEIVPEAVVRLIKIVFGIGILVGLSFVLYQPFAESYALGYAETRIWEGTHTPISAYLVHWGVFLFVIVSWMVWETLDWMAKTPVSALRKLKPLFAPILLIMVVLVGGIVYLMVEIDAPVSWLVMLLATWAGALLLRPGMTDAKRLVLFLIGTGLVLTQTVEVIVLSGDVGRMNTVFKFYLQVWVLFGVSAAASLGWLASEAGTTLHEYLEKFASPVQRTWQFVLTMLVFGAVMYPIMAGMARAKDRMVENVPVTLNGQEYLTLARYNYNGVDMALNEDYRAMRWMEENVQGSPTIVEAQLVEYNWGSRFSINTGLPAVLGWNWHQRQQRTGHDQDVWQRATEIADFYNSPIQQTALDFLNRYNVRYIIVGQLERSYYSPDGLAKFEAWNGQFWHEVYRDGQTVIYEVGGS